MTARNSVAVLLGVWLLACGVGAQKPAPIVLTPSSLTLAVGETRTLTASVPIKSWSVNDPTIATLSGAGLVTGVAAGTTVITAKSGPYIAQAIVTVTVPPVPDLPPPATLVVTCPANLALVSPDGLPVTGTYTATTTGGLAPITITATPASGSLFAVGQSSVAVHAVSSDGQISDCAFSVTVSSTTPQPGGGTIVAKSCASADVQAALTAAPAGSTVVMPNGACTWTVGVTVSRGVSLRGASKTGVVITNSVTATNAIQVTEDTVFRSQVSNFSMHLNMSRHAISVYPNNAPADTNGKAVLIHDIAFDNGHAIQMRSNRGVIYGNTLTQPVAAPYLWNTGQFVMCVPVGLTSWTTNHTLGTADLTGESNVYVEDNTLNYATSEGFDLSDSCRAVVRHNTMNHSAVGSHGPDSGTDGLRQAEIYDNSFLFTNYGDCDGSKTASIDYQIYLRGGIGVITDNFLTLLQSCAYGLKSSIKMLVEMPWRNAGPYHCWTGGYPVPHQLGQGVVQGAAALERFYVWNNTGTANQSPAFSGYPNECGTSGASQTIGTYLQLGRDAIVGTARPGYAKYPYPHPLRAQ